MKCDYQYVHELTKKYGSRLFIFDEAKLEKNYHEMLNEYRGKYEKIAIAYSYKTNYLPYLLEKINTMGAYAEVVSSMEYNLALKIGVDAQKIIFNGPFKKYYELEKALLNASLVNLDSFSEIESLKKFVNKFPQKHISLGIRCNFLLPAINNSRFGFNTENGSLERAIKEVHSLSPEIRVTALHAHYSSKDRSPEMFAEITKKLIALSIKYLGKEQVKIIDIGGGFFSKMPVSMVKEFGKERIPTFSDYARAVCYELNKVKWTENKPLLIIEPGTALVADTFYFLTEVIDVKNILDKTIVLVDGSKHDVAPTMHQIKLPLRLLSPQKRQKADNAIDIAGYSCMENDYLIRNFSYQCQKGDYLLFSQVGAYTIVFKPPFIRPAAPIVAIKDNSIRLVRTAQSEEELFSSFKFSSS